MKQVGLNICFCFEMNFNELIANVLTRNLKILFKKNTVWSLLPLFSLRRDTDSSDFARWPLSDNKRKYVNTTTPNRSQALSTRPRPPSGACAACATYCGCMRLSRDKGRTRRHNGGVPTSKNKPRAFDICTNRTRQQRPLFSNCAFELNRRASEQLSRLFRSFNRFFLFLNI